MALITKQIKRLAHPTEPDTWFDVRLPVTAGDMAGMRATGNVGMKLDLLAVVLVDWSYPAPITLDTVNSLDLDTFNWLQQVIFDASGIRDEPEKKDFVASSSPTSAQGEDNSPASSGT